MLQLYVMGDRSQNRYTGHDTDNGEDMTGEAVHGDRIQNRADQNVPTMAALAERQSRLGSYTAQSYLNILQGQWPRGTRGAGEHRSVPNPGASASLANVYHLLGALGNPGLRHQSSMPQQGFSLGNSSIQDALSRSTNLGATHAGLLGVAATPKGQGPSLEDCEQAARIASSNASRHLLNVLSPPALQQDHLINLLRSSNAGGLTPNAGSHNTIPSSLQASSSSWLTGRAAPSGLVLDIPGRAASTLASTPDLHARQIPGEEPDHMRQQKVAGAQASAAPAKKSSAGSSSSPQDSSGSGFSLVLYMDGDENSLTEYQCLLRQQLEIFEAGPRDVRSSSQGRNTPILLGQVGLRCRHCATLPVAARTKGAIYFSQTIDGIYQIAQNMSKVHLCERCYRIPPDIQRRLVALRSDCRRASGGKEYWAEGIRLLGVYEDGHILRMRKPTTDTKNTK